MNRGLPFQDHTPRIRLKDMWKWPLQKIFQDRDRIARDLGYVGMGRPFHQHLDDLLTMILRMAITLCVAVMVAFYWAKELLAGFTHHFFATQLADKTTQLANKTLDGWTLDPRGVFMMEVDSWLCAGLIIPVALVLCFRIRLNIGRTSTGKLRSLK